MSFFESIKYLKPEIAVSITLVAIVVLDLIFSNKKIISSVSVLGLLSAGYFLFENIGVTHSAFPEPSLNKSIGFLSIDPFGTFFKFFVIASSIFIVFFSISSNEIKKNIKRSGEYFALIFGMIIGMMFMINSVNLILIYISLEIVSLSSYVLAGFTKLEKRNSEASLKYLIYGASSSGIMLFGISIIYGLTGTTNLLEINQVLTSIPVNPVTLSLCLILIFAGIGYKISSVPFHFWTPDVYEGAPVSITAFLSIASKAAGFALLIRFIKSG
ncbi:MAG: NADH-quinone oxidoreductase subunit N, partial [Ignavibacteria bacterium]|nr:NADH-quinone oxidoreductase subunit N [Ignavibacteria bacterium]